MEAKVNAVRMIFFSPNSSIKNPEGIDINPYAAKKDKGKNEAIFKLKLKLLIISGTNGPIILVKNEIIKNINMIKQNNKGFFLMVILCEN